MVAPVVSSGTVPEQEPARRGRADAGGRARRWRRSAHRRRERAGQRHRRRRAEPGAEDEPGLRVRRWLLRWLSASAPSPDGPTTARTSFHHERLAGLIGTRRRGLPSGAGRRDVGGTLPANELSPGDQRDGVPPRADRSDDGPARIGGGRPRFGAAGAAVAGGVRGAAAGAVAGAGVRRRLDMGAAGRSDRPVRAVGVGRHVRPGVPAPGAVARDGDHGPAGRAPRPGHPVRGERSGAHRGRGRRRPEQRGPADLGGRAAARTRRDRRIPRARRGDRTRRAPAEGATRLRAVALGAPGVRRGHRRVVRSARLADRRSRAGPRHAVGAGRAGGGARRRAGTPLAGRGAGFERARCARGAPRVSQRLHRGARPTRHPAAVRTWPVRLAAPVASRHPAGGASVHDRLVGGQRSMRVHGPLHRRLRHGGCGG